MIFDKYYLLFFIPLSLIPFLIYFLIKIRKKEVIFPSLVIFEDITSKEIRKINYLKYMILVLRFLFIFLIILAFATPYADIGFLNKFGMSDKKSDITLMILIDNSYSMDAIYDKFTAFEKNIFALEKIIESLSDKSNVLILSFSDDIENYTNFISPKDAMKKIKNSFNILYYSTNYSRAFKKVQELINKESNEKKIIFLASDNSLNGIDSNFQLLKNIDVVSLDIKDVPLNFWFEDIKRNVYRDSNLYYLKINGKLKSSKIFSGIVNIRYCDYTSCGNIRMVKFDKSKVEDFEFNFNLKENCGYIEILKDNLSKDNRYYLCADIVSKKILSLYSGNDIVKPGKTAFFMKEILNILKEKTNLFDIDFEKVDNFNIEKIKNYSRIIINGSIPNFLFERIIKEKIPFLYIPDYSENDLYNLKNFFDNFERIKNSFLLSNSDFSGSMYAHNNFIEVYINNLYILRGNNKLNFPLLFKSNSIQYPAIVEIPYLKSYIFTFNLDIDNSNFAIKPSFIDIMKEIITGDILEQKNNFFIGEEVYRDKISTQIMNLKDNFFKNANTFKCIIPGNYIMRYGNSDFYFSCNIDTRKNESELKKIKNPLWKELSEKNYLKEFYMFAYKRDISTFIFIIAILILSMENFILWKYF